ncbi:GntR family transcriptional regulator [Streptomyces odontomachi]|uniref:GntR family transcriptional regulator n=1 Tax=Streptomyces odontomachi TaxID=2944940 RepID=UPI002109294C|nr:GntR family transcriptional regulator [Streptomyces sp. ODS25]
MPGDIKRPEPLYKQLAAALAEAIAAGEYAPGELLPSETQLMSRYDVSRPTARSAVAELRNMGLVTSQHGKGTLVRGAETTTPRSTVARGINRAGKALQLTDSLIVVEAGTVTRTHLEGMVGELLERPDEAAFTCDRLLADPETGDRTAHRLYIPFDVAEKVPALAETPDAEPADIYNRLVEAGHALMWTEYPSARNPVPDERAALNVPDGAPILVSHRVTLTDNGHPLVCEELRTSAAHTRLAFRITPEKVPARRKARSV